MDTLLQTVVTQIPNLGVAIWMLWQQQQTIKSLLDTQQRVIDRLMNNVLDENEQRAIVMYDEP